MIGSKLPTITMPARSYTNHRDTTELRELPEGRFIEYLRAANIVSNDVKKTLDEKLGTRSSCAHPSGVTIKRSKVIDFIDDLVTNIIKFPA